MSQSYTTYISCHKYTLLHIFGFNTQAVFPVLRKVNIIVMVIPFTIQVMRVLAGLQKGYVAFKNTNSKGWLLAYLA